MLRIKGGGNDGDTARIYSLTTLTGLTCRFQQTFIFTLLALCGHAPCYGSQLESMQLVPLRVNLVKS